MKIVDWTWTHVYLNDQYGLDKKIILKVKMKIRIARLLPKAIWISHTTNCNQSVTRHKAQNKKASMTQDWSKRLNKLNLTLGQAATLILKLTLILIKEHLQQQDISTQLKV